MTQIIINRAETAQYLGYPHTRSHRIIRSATKHQEATVSGHPRSRSRLSDCHHSASSAQRVIPSPLQARLAPARGPPGSLQWDGDENRVSRSSHHKHAQPSADSHALTRRGTEQVHRGAPSAAVGGLFSTRILLLHRCCPRCCNCSRRMCGIDAQSFGELRDTLVARSHGAQLSRHRRRAV